MDGTSKTPLYNASEEGNTVLVRELIIKGAMVNVIGDEGDTPLHRAASLADPEIVRMLISAGAKVGAVDGDGLTSLELTIMVGRMNPAEVIDVLVKAGADIHKNAFYGLSAIELAERHLDGVIKTNFKSEEQKDLIVEKLRIVLKRVKYHTKCSPKSSKQKMKPSSASTKQVMIQDGSEAVNNSVSNSDTLANKSNMPLEIGLLVAGLLAVSGIGVFVIRKR